MNHYHPKHELIDDRHPSFRKAMADMATDEPFVDPDRTLTPGELEAALAGPIRESTRRRVEAVYGRRKADLQPKPIDSGMALVGGLGVHGAGPHCGVPAGRDVREGIPMIGWLLFLLLIGVLCVDWRRDVRDARPPCKKWPASHGWCDDRHSSPHPDDVGMDLPRRWK